MKYNLFFKFSEFIEVGKKVLESIYKATRHNIDINQIRTEGFEAFENNNEDELEIIFWDFAGQDIYYTTHQVSTCIKAVVLFYIYFRSIHKYFCGDEKLQFGYIKTFWPLFLLYLQLLQCKLQHTRNFCTPLNIDHFWSSIVKKLSTRLFSVLIFYLFCFVSDDHGVDKSIFS